MLQMAFVFLFVTVAFLGFYHWKQLVTIRGQKLKFGEYRTSTITNSVDRIDRCIKQTKHCVLLRERK